MARKRKKDRPAGTGDGKFAQQQVEILYLPPAAREALERAERLLAERAAAETRRGEQP